MDMLLSISVSCALLIAVILLARALLLHKLHPGTFLALWAVALCRLLLPVSLPSRFSIRSLANTLPTVWEPIAPMPVVSHMPVAAPTNPLNPAAAEVASAVNPGLVEVGGQAAAGSGGIDIVSVLPWLWLAGALLVAAFFIITHLRWRGLYRTALPVDTPFVHHWLLTHPTRRKISIMQVEGIAAPLTYGLLSPVILLPHNTGPQNEQQLAYILAHEYVHIKRCDVLWKYLLTAALALHWFNPLVWLMYKTANRDLELACDGAVLRGCGAGNRAAYARTLLCLMEKQQQPMPICNNFSRRIGKNAIEERIVHIMNMKKTTFIGIAASFVVVAVIAIIFATSPAVQTQPAAALTIGDIEMVDAQMDILYDNLHAATDAWQEAIAEANALNPRPEGYREHELFVSWGEPALKITYDGQTWEYHDTALENQYWRWYTYDEYKAWSDYLNEFAKIHSTDIPQETLDKNRAAHAQMLADIKNGIKMRQKGIVVLDPGPQASTSFNPHQGGATWLCFSYSFTDKTGNTVDLGLFETRDQLFAALRQYYNAEIAAGRMNQAEADEAYNNIYHTSRFSDEQPLQERLDNGLGLW